jgi:hypothetical protein
LLAKFFTDDVYFFLVSLITEVIFRAKRTRHLYLISIFLIFAAGAVKAQVITVTASGEIDSTQGATYSSVPIGSSFTFQFSIAANTTAIVTGGSGPNNYLEDGGPANLKVSFQGVDFSSSGVEASVANGAIEGSFGFSVFNLPVTNTLVTNLVLEGNLPQGTGTLTDLLLPSESGGAPDPHTFLFANQNTGAVLYGEVTSYSAVETPEPLPSNLFVLGFAAIMLWRLGVSGRRIQDTPTS